MGFSTGFEGFAIKSKPTQIIASAHQTLRYPLLGDEGVAVAKLLDEMDMGHAAQQ
jgi:hypothetical protein